ncbi:MAG: EamA family transporter RarD, partial [Actinomycetota bacterium]
NSASSWQFALVLLSGIATITPLLLFAHSAQRVPLTVIGPMQYIVPSMNFLIGWLMYDEALPGSRLVGFALVWLGLVLLTVDSLGRARRRRA